MTLDLDLHTGKPGKPAVILIHGLAMNKYFWAEPEKCQALGGLAPITMFLSGPPDSKIRARISTGTIEPGLAGLRSRLIEAGFSVASWSQRRPLGPVSAVVKELNAVMKEVGKVWPKKPVFLAGHSRGGLIARMFVLETSGEGIEGLITLCSPHTGTSMAGFVKYLRPAAPVLERMIPKDSRGTMTTALERLTAFLQSRAIQELAPGSKFLESLKSPPQQALRQLSFGGTDPSLFSLYVRMRPEDKWRVLSLPDLLLKALPSNSLPDELTTGKGDALVSAASAVLEGGRHYDFPANHVRIPFDPRVQKIILEFIEE